MCLELEAIFHVYYIHPFFSSSWFEAQVAYSHHDVGSLSRRWYWVYGELFHELTEEFSLPYNYYEADMLDWNLQSEGLRSLKFVAHVNTRSV
jgi:hypothetical protein